MEEEKTSTTSQHHDLPYEEMSVVEPQEQSSTLEKQGVESTFDDVVPEAAKVFAPSISAETPKPPVDTASTLSSAPATADIHPKQKKFRIHMGTILFVGILFVLGVWLSGQVRSLFSTSETSQNETTQEQAESQVPISATGSAMTRDETWKTYEISPSTRTGVFASATYALPDGVAAPSCDGTQCLSYGTNLPGGTRFTVAPRGTGQRLPDFRGAILTDVNGREFAMKEVRIGEYDVYEYTGTFTGVTLGGYPFIRMRGVLIPLSDTQSVEMNHFAPPDSASDFAADDVLFEGIVQSLRFDRNNIEGSQSGSLR